MGVSRFYTKTVTTERLTDVGGGSKRQDWQQVESSLSCAIQPLSPDEVALEGGGFHNTFRMFCARTADIEIGDRVVDGSDKYKVAGKSDHNIGSTLDHLSLTLMLGK